MKDKPILGLAQMFEALGIEQTGPTGKPTKVIFQPELLAQRCYTGREIRWHSHHCYTFGPLHYECALRKIEELESAR